MILRGRARIVAMILGVALVAAVILLFVYRQAAGDFARQCVAFFREAGAWPFFIAMAVLPAFGFPLSLFTATAGPVFGPTMGVINVILCGLAAEAVNMAATYWIAARGMRPLVERLVKWTGHTVRELPPAAAWEVTLLVRIIPGPPFCLQSYLLGLARAPFGIYMGVSLLVHLGYLVGAVVAGDAIMRGDWRAFAIGGLIFFVIGAVVHRLRKRLTAGRKSE